MMGANLTTGADLTIGADPTMGANPRTGTDRCRRQVIKCHLSATETSL